MSKFASMLNVLRRQKIIENTKKIMEDARLTPLPKYLNFKVRQESMNKGYLPPEIIKKISSDEMYASWFAKDPLKQNIAEIVQLEILKSRFPNIKKLPTRGEGAVYLGYGKIIKNLPTKPIHGSKSLDFFNPDTNTYYICKYTKASGGAQDNQFQDVIKTIKEANLIRPEIHTNFVCLLDGDYYTSQKLEVLRKLVENPNLRITTSSDL